MSTRDNDPDDELDVEETDVDEVVVPEGTPQVQEPDGVIGQIREPLPPGTDDPNWVDPNTPADPDARTP